MTLENSDERFKTYVSQAKSPTNFMDLHAYSLELRSQHETVGILLPVSNADLDNEDSIRLLSKWRNEAGSTAFLNHEDTSIESTKKWLQGRVLSDSRKCLYWLLDKYGVKKIGHMGLVVHPEIPNLVELDNVIRGEESQKGLMSLAVETLGEFAERRFGFESFFLRVKSDNLKAVEFYKRLNFKPVSTIDTKCLENHSEHLTTMQKRISPAFRLPVLTAGPHLDETDYYRVANAARYEWNADHSNSLSELERKMTVATGRKYAIATSSCTGAMHLSLLASGIGPGDEVIVPDITWVATASVVRYVGAEPVFADVDRSSWVIDLGSVEKLITKKTKAIMPVHLYGVSPNMNQLMDFANTHNLLVIEDAAPALGSYVSGIAAGGHGDAACFSFQGAKIAVAGEGGALVTDNELIYQKARQLNEHGRKPGSFDIEMLGYKYKPSNLSGALAIGQLDKIDYLSLRKKRINSWYRDALSDFEEISFQESTHDSEPNFWMTSILLNGKPRTKEMALHLKSQGVDTRPVFPQLSSFPMWKTEKDNLNSEYIASRGINLPSGSLLTESMVGFVSETVIKFLQYSR